MAAATGTKYCSRWFKVTFEDYPFTKEVLESGTRSFLRAANCLDNPNVLVLRDLSYTRRNLCFLAFKDKIFNINNPERAIMNHFQVEKFTHVKRPCGGSAGHTIDARKRAFEIISSSAMWDTMSPVMCTGNVFTKRFSGLDTGLRVAPPMFTSPPLTTIKPFKKRRFINHAHDDDVVATNPSPCKRLLPTQTTTTPPPPTPQPQGSPPTSFKRPINGGHLVYGAPPVQHAIIYTQSLETAGGHIIKDINTYKKTTPSNPFSVYLTVDTSLAYSKQVGELINIYEKVLEKPIIVIIPGGVDAPRKSPLFRHLQDEVGVVFQTVNTYFMAQQLQQRRSSPTASPLSSSLPSSSSLSSPAQKHPVGNSRGVTTRLFPFAVSTTVIFKPVLPPPMISSR